MIVKEVRKGRKRVPRIYHKRKCIFRREAVIFQEVDTFQESNDTLIIHGAFDINNLPVGLYLDCLPGNSDVEWTYPKQDGNVLTIKQVASAILSGNVLEVK